MIRDLCSLTVVLSLLCAAGSAPAPAQDSPIVRENQLPGATAVVKFVDADGKIIKEDARKLLGLTELQTVVVRGAAERDDEGNLTILADGLFVRK